MDGDATRRLATARHRPSERAMGPSIGVPVNAKRLAKVHRPLACGSPPPSEARKCRSIYAIRPPDGRPYGSKTPLLGGLEIGLRGLDHAEIDLEERLVLVALLLVLLPQADDLLEDLDVVALVLGFVEDRLLVLV